MRIGFMSDNITVASGYGKVAKYLAEGLTERGFTVSQFALQYAGRPIMVDDVKVYQGMSLSMLPNYFDEERPDVLIHLRDNWVFTSFFPNKYEIIKFVKWKGAKVVLYTPAGESPYPDEFIQPCREADLTLTTSNWSKRQLVSAGAPAERTDVLYHGVNTKVFEPNPGIDVARLGFDPSAQLIGMVGVNTVRKDFPRLLRAYARLTQERKVQLHLHTQPRRSDGFDLAVFLDQLGVKGRVSFPEPPVDAWWGTGEQGLSDIYNCMSVYVHCSKCEGFGLPLVEAMACGIPLVACDNTAIPEIIGDGGLLVPCPNVEYTNFGGNYWLADEQKLHDTILSVLEDSGLRKELSRRGVARARSPEFDWKNITERLVKILEGL